MTKILIAEDERDIRDLITFTLRFGGYEVVAGSNGEEAVALAKQEKPDLILLDVRMPRMTGYEACAAIKAVPQLRDIPVIFLSAKGQDSEIQAGMQAGASEYLLKPFAPDQLITRIQSVLAKAPGSSTAPTLIEKGPVPPAPRPATGPFPAQPSAPKPAPLPPAAPVFRPPEPGAQAAPRPATGPQPEQPSEPKPSLAAPVPAPTPVAPVPPAVVPPQSGPAEERPAEGPAAGSRPESSRVRRYLFGSRAGEASQAPEKPIEPVRSSEPTPPAETPPDISRTWQHLFGAKATVSKPEEEKPSGESPAAENAPDDGRPSDSKPEDDTPPEA